MKIPIRIAILTSTTPGNVYLVNRILAEFEVTGIVVESPAPATSRDEKMRRRAALFERYGTARTLNKLVFNWYRARFISPRQALVMQRAFWPDGRPPAYRRDVPTITVANINDAQVVRLLDDLRPDVIAVCGTTVIKPEVFSRARIGAINIHTGITPEYRSADPIFWALYNGEPQNVGVTIHYVDEGIDTGPVINHERVPVLATDDLATIAARCIRRGADLYVDALRAIADGSAHTIDRGGATGKAYYSIDLGIIQYLAFMWRFRRLARRLPQPDHQDKI